MITSEIGGVGGFDPTERMGRATLMARIENWAKNTKARTSPDRRSVVIFYYFGHGVADGMSRSAFLEPEAFIDDPEKRVDQIAGRLIGVDWIIDVLQDVSDRVVMVVDACREHGSEDEQLVDKFPGGDAQRTNLGDILEAIQFSTGSSALRSHLRQPGWHQCCRGPR